jgi:hypothetical protein
MLVAFNVIRGFYVELYVSKREFKTGNQKVADLLRCGIATRIAVGIRAIIRDGRTATLAIRAGIRMDRPGPPYQSHQAKPETKIRAGTYAIIHYLNGTRPDVSSAGKCRKVE